MNKVADTSVRISLEVVASNNVSTAYINSNDVQVAFNHFLKQNPQVLVQIFERLVNTSITPHRAPLPCLNKEPREAILASIKITPYPDKDANSEEWIKNIQSSRFDKDNYPPFFDEIVEDK